jgi:hypothetical protein
MFVRMPFGFASSPAKFTAVMQAIFGPYKEFLLVYFDNLLIFSRTYEEHLKHVTIVLQLCNQFQLRLNQLKSQFLCVRLPFLGFVLSNNGITPDPKKSAAIEAIPIPNTIKNLQRFIGAITYNRIFIPKVAELLKPLYDVITEVGKGKIPASHQGKVNTAVQQVKLALRMAIALQFPPEDSSVPIVMYTDASDFAIAGTIGFHNQDNQLAILGTYSRILQSYERHYTTTKKELLAIFECVKRFKFLLYGRQSIIAFTDHISLCFPDGVKEDQSRTEHHWWVSIQHFPILIVHIPGKENVLADYLSRDLYPTEIDKPKHNTTQVSEPTTDQATDVPQLSSFTTFSRSQQPARWHSATTKQLLFLKSIHSKSPKPRSPLRPAPKLKLKLPRQVLPPLLHPPLLHPPPLPQPLSPPLLPNISPQLLSPLLSLTLSLLLLQPQLILPHHCYLLLPPLFLLHPLLHRLPTTSQVIHLPLTIPRLSSFMPSPTSPKPRPRSLKRIG